MDTYQILALIVILSWLFIIFKWAKSLPNKRSEKEMMAYTQRLLQNLIPIAVVLATQAEIEFGRKTNELKRSSVIYELYKLIPDEFKPYVTEVNFDVILSAALDKAEELWQANTKIKELTGGMNK
jgi:hypothetical protein